MTFLSSDIRNDFPVLADRADTFAYLDTAATSQTPLSVIEAMDAYYRTYRANIHRGLYTEAQRASQSYEDARGVVAEFIGARRTAVVFTSGATASANMLAGMLARALDLGEGGEIVATVTDHHAALLPFRRLAEESGATFKTIGTDGTHLSTTDIQHISDRTKIVSVPLASNVIGTINDIGAIVHRAREVGAWVVVDGTAAVGHMPVRVDQLDADFLYFSGHKMCGPTGIGVLFGKHNLLYSLTPSILGGGIVADVSLTDTTFKEETPERFEAGTPNIAGALGLAEAVRYIDNIGLERIAEHVSELTAEALDRLNAIGGVHVYSAPAEENIGIISFTVEGIHPHDVAQILAQEGVAVRAGHHCAHPLAKELGVSATVRASFYLYNQSSDIDALERGIKKAQEIFKKN